jgi:hypothetical protein
MGADHIAAGPVEQEGRKFQVEYQMGLFDRAFAQRYNIEDT